MMLAHQTNVWERTRRFYAHLSFANLGTDVWYLSPLYALTVSEYQNRQQVCTDKSAGLCLAGKHILRILLVCWLWCGRLGFNKGYLCLVPMREALFRKLNSYMISLKQTSLNFANRTRLW
jgi:hypothetical protein